MSTKSIILLGFCIALCHSVKFAIQIPAQTRQCFYQVLADSQKYSLQLTPTNDPKYELEISQNFQGTWNSIFYKMTTMAYQRIEVHKFAQMGTTYSFCLKNIQSDVLVITIKFKTGVQLMQFQLLPDKSDTENLDRQITWLENEKKSLYETIRNVENYKNINTDRSALLSWKMIMFAVLGLVGIVGVNFVFFREVKRVFKDRKLI